MLNEKDFPRVLLVGYSCFESTTGGGITLSNLFRGWPREKLAVVSEIDYPPDLEICDQYYKLGSLENHWIWPLSLFQRRWVVSGPMTISMTQNAPASKGLVVKDVRPENVRQRSFNGLVKIGLEELLYPAKLSRNLLAWVQLYKPDVIYTQLASLNRIRLVKQLCDATGAELAIHIMDDWPTTLYHDRWLSFYIQWRMDIEFRMLINRAKVLMAISPYMSQVYQERYGKKFVTFHNPLNLKDWLKVSKTDWNVSSPFRLVYTGRIGNANQKSLKDICEAVEYLNNNGYSIQFQIFTPDYQSELSKILQKARNVFVNTPVPHDLIPTILSNADTLILPLDFDPRSIQYSQYSMPTKAPEYMVSGTPILVYAPEKTAVAEYAHDEHWGVVVSEQGATGLIKGILLLMQDKALREQLGFQARQIAIERFDAETVRVDFRQTLLSAK